MLGCRSTVNASRGMASVGLAASDIITLLYSSSEMRQQANVKHDGSFPSIGGFVHLTYSDSQNMIVAIVMARAFLRFSRVPFQIFREGWSPGAFACDLSFKMSLDR